MSKTLNYYKVLGVLPSADQIVVTAAYRALAGHYHPDRWKGDINFATERMAEINVAYGVLGDPSKRSIYDERRDPSSDSFDRSETEEAFDQALCEIEIQWETAVAIIPDLIDIRKRLSKIATRLAFSFVTTILETKQFNKRFSLANELEDQFLELHFGTNHEIKTFARKIIEIGNRNAIRSLNNYLIVLGSDAAPNQIIQKVIEDYQLEIHFSNKDRELRVNDLKRYILNGNSIEYAMELVGLYGLAVIQKKSWLFRQTRFDVFSFEKVDGKIKLILDNVTASEFIDWVRINICSQYE